MSEIWWTMCIGLHIKYPLFLSVFFNETWIFSTDFWKIIKYQIQCTSVQWEPSCATRTDGRMDMKQTFAFRNFAYPLECDSRATLSHLYVRTCRSFRNSVITGSMNSVSYFGPCYYPDVGLTFDWHPWLSYQTLRAFVIVCWHSFVHCTEFHVSVVLKARRIWDACGVFSSQRASSCVFVFADSYRHIGESKDGYLCVRVSCVCVLRYEQILWYVQQGFMPFISVRLHQFLL